MSSQIAALLVVVLLAIEAALAATVVLAALEAKGEILQVVVALSSST